MSTQTTTTTTNTNTNTETMASKVLDAGGVFWAADGEKKSSKYSYDEDTTKNPIFPLNLVGLALPPLPVLAVPLALAYYRSIPFWDLFFSIAFPIYLGLANRFRFDNNANLYNLRKQQSKEFPERPDWFVQNQEKWFMKYMIFAATLGVLVPLLVQFFAPEAVAQVTAPHLFILVCQIVMEHMVYNPKCHPVIQIITPIGFSAYRMSTLKTWVALAFEMMMNATGNNTDVVLTWGKAHFVLALANAVFWTYNLCVMLTLRVLPPNFDQEKFLDSNVSWEKCSQLIPSLNQTTTTSDSSKKTE